MMYLKKSFTGNLGISILGSIIATFIYNGTGYFFTAPAGSPFPWLSLVISGVIFLILFLCYFWVKSLLTSLNKTLVHIRQTGMDYFGTPLLHNDKEEGFHSACQQKIQNILQMCVAATGLKPKIIRDEIHACSVILAPDNSHLVIRNLYDPNGKFGLKLGDVIKKDHYFSSWVLNENETKHRNELRGRKQFGGDLVLVQDMPEIGIRSGALPFKSGISVALKLEETPVGVLVVGTDKRDYLTPEDVFPVAIVGQYLTVTYAHMKDYCPWHRKGWRDEKFEDNIKLREFVFSFDDYQRTSMLDRKLSEALSSSFITENEKNDLFIKYTQLCRSIVDLKDINAMYLCGTFSGWSPNKTLMKKDSKDLTWRCNLHLPKGDYWYQFRILFGSKEEWIFDPKSPLWLDSSKKLQSVLTLK